MRDIFSFLFIALAFLVAVFTLACAIVFAGISFTCSGYEEVTGKETKVVALTCYIKEDNNWFTYEELKFRNATKGN